jgi:NADH:ubiquinone oxidoreductase subunit 5 (subunit L)/multisubunit Na+/H+ antiporter MnhA subunit
MENSILILLGIYFAINLLLTGAIFKEVLDDFNEDQNLISLCKAILTLILYLTVSTLIIICLTVRDWLVSFWNWINQIWQISFWFSFIFTKNWHNVEKRVLVNLNQRAQQKKTNSIRDRIFRKSVELLNARNNSIPENNS